MLPKAAPKFIRIRVLDLTAEAPKSVVIRP